MPNCDFYALGEDHRVILDHVFAEGSCRVFELSSPFDSELAEFRSIADVEARFQISNWGESHRDSILLQLYPNDAAGKLVIRRIKLIPHKCNGAKFRYACEGWGLVQLYLESVRRGQFCLSHTNHNSEKRALAWESVVGNLGKAKQWDWSAVNAFSRRLNQFIASCSVHKIGSHRVLPKAAEFLRSQATGPNPYMAPHVKGRR